MKSMETYCASCKNKNSSVRKTKQNRIVLVLNCTVCGKKKSRFFKIVKKLGDENSIK